MEMMIFTNSRNLSEEQLELCMRKVWECLGDAKAKAWIPELLSVD
jgi:hypothetical protein